MRPSNFVHNDRSRNCFQFGAHLLRQICILFRCAAATLHSDGRVNVDLRSAAKPLPSALLGTEIGPDRAAVRDARETLQAIAPKGFAMLKALLALFGVGFIPRDGTRCFAARQRRCHGQNRLCETHSNHLL
jgi:hypothetical protein